MSTPIAQLVQEYRKDLAEARVHGAEAVRLMEANELGAAYGRLEASTGAIRRARSAIETIAKMTASPGSGDER